MEVLGIKGFYSNLFGILIYYYFRIGANVKIFITGNMGYVGPVLNKVIQREYPYCEIVGYDTGFFAHCLTCKDLHPEFGVSIQYFGDVRDIKHTDLNGVDAVIHLAGISNDPIGNEFEAVTFDINLVASIRLAKLSVDAGVKNFVFASSCSMYGTTEGGLRKETDPTKPLTAYARSKIWVEDAISELDLGSMVFTSLRFATACGWSPRLRLDLVLNDFVASAITSSEITVLSDGTPWRPLIDVEDMSRAICWAANRNADNGGQFLAVNAGCNESNYQVKELACEVAKQVPGTKISINPNALPDKRSYAVDFTLYKRLAPYHQPKITLQESIQRLYFGLSAIAFDDKDFRESHLIRLNTLNRHMAAGRVDSYFRWMVCK